jgi:lactate permease
MTWIQVYDPFGHWWIASLVAAVPLAVLFGMLTLGRAKPHWAAAAGATTALAIASLAFTMPLKLAAVSFVYGIAFGLLKIAWIVVAAVYLYDVSVYTGQFDIMKQSVARITPDRRLQLLLVAFCFGAFLEGAAGFGAPVAIAGAFMIGLGFRPFHAATLNLIANTAPVAWGSIGTPLHTLAAVMALPEQPLNSMLGRILPFTAVLVPFWLVRAMVGWSETLEVLPAILVVGISFGATQFLWSNFVDGNLVDIVSGVVSMVAVLVFLRFWQPRRIWRFEEDRATPQAPDLQPKELQPEDLQTEDLQPKALQPQHSTGAVVRAWMPFAILSACVLLWGLPPVKNAMNRATTPAFERKGWNVPVLHNAVLRAPPVVATPTPEPAKFDFNWLTATGSGCFVAAVLTGLLLRVDPRDQLRLFLRTLHRMRYAVLAICLMLGFGFITRYSGMDAVLALAFTRTGVLFPFFGTFLGWLGVALTGSDTSSNALFGPLQRITAQQLGLSPVLMGAANSAGGVMGKMVDAQSICVATAATNQVGNEGTILRFLFWHSIALAGIVGIIVMTYAYIFPGAIPH